MKLYNEIFKAEITIEEMELIQKYIKPNMELAEYNNGIVAIDKRIDKIKLNSLQEVVDYCIRTSVMRRYCLDNMEMKNKILQEKELLIAIKSRLIIDERVVI